MLTLWRNARLATCADPNLGLIDRGALVTEAGRILYAGPEADAPSATDSVDCEGRWITPALIDCHTHLVYGGDRAREFELRLDRRVLRRDRPRRRRHPVHRRRHPRGERGGAG